MSTEPRGECVTQSNGREVNIGRLHERLVVSPGIGNHQKSRLPGGLLDLVPEGARSKAAGNGSGSSGSSRLQHSLLASVSGRCDTDISGVLNGNNGMGWQQTSSRFSAD